jgi:hypothetical protein
MDDGGNTKDDLKLPKGTEEADKLADLIQKEFDDGKELAVVVLKVFTLSPSSHLLFQLLYKRGFFGGLVVRTSIANCRYVVTSVLFYSCFVMEKVACHVDQIALYACRRWGRK